VPVAALEKERVGERVVGKVVQVVGQKLNIIGCRDRWRRFL
jgi:hypothetical protein